jgi:hypothetical protein
VWKKNLNLTLIKGFSLFGNGLFVSCRKHAICVWVKWLYCLGEKIVVIFCVMSITIYGSKSVILCIFVVVRSFIFLLLMLQSCPCPQPVFVLTFSFQELSETSYGHWNCIFAKLIQNPSPYISSIHWQITDLCLNYCGWSSILNTFSWWNIVCVLFVLQVDKCLVNTFLRNSNLQLLLHLVLNSFVLSLFSLNVSN